MNPSLLAQRLLALFVAAALVFNFPLIALWDSSVKWWGIPLFALAMFTLWALLIALLAWLVERSPD
ncbi:MAG: hypothetical protein AB1735_08865 [Pseudomonadota bacterium]|jgi:hypothetical protein